MTFSVDRKQTQCGFNKAIFRQRRLKADPQDLFNATINTLLRNLEAPDFVVEGGIKTLLSCREGTAGSIDTVWQSRRDEGGITLL